MTQTQWLNLFLALKEKLEEDGIVEVMLINEDTGSVSMKSGGRQVAWRLSDELYS